MGIALSGLLAKRGIVLRSDLRRALLAAAESCWVYAAMLTVGSIANSPRLLTPVGIWATYFAALEIGHYLPLWRRSLRVLRLVNVGLAFLVLLAVIRFDLYRDLPLFSLSWAGVFLRELFSTTVLFTPAQIAAVTLLYAYVRGSGFGQRPLTLWFIGFQFRLGVLVLFFVSLLAIIIRPPDLLPPMLAYFVISLIGVALARIDESGREQGLGPRWALLLIAACAIIVMLALFVTPFFTLSGVNALFALLEPLLPVFAIILSIFLIPLGWVISLLIDLLAPLFSGLSRIFAQLQLRLPAQAQEPLSRLPETLSQYAYLLDYVRILGFILLIFDAGLLVARALNRRMLQAEEEGYFREPVEPLDARPKEKRPRPQGRPKRGHIEAENIRRMYAALQARSASLGLPRREAETPLEFLPRLVLRFPDLQPDLQALTEAYVDVHYGEQVATPEQVREMRTVWLRLRKGMTAENGRRKASR